MLERTCLEAPGAGPQLASILQCALPHLHLPALLKAALLDLML